MKQNQRLDAALVASFAAALAGCGAESWTPPAPAGVTYQYDYQGFRERKTNVIAGAFAGPAPGMGMAYGGAFSFRNESELRGHAEADPFAESTPIDGIRFNEHLGAQGRRLLQPALGTAASAPPAASSAPRGSPPPPPAGSVRAAPPPATSSSQSPPAPAPPASMLLPPPAPAPANPTPRSGTI